MSGLQRGNIERPVDFSYDTCWFECPECDDRVAMSFEDRDVGESRTCLAGHEVSAQELHPALTDLDDPATDAANIGRMVWYHSTTRSDWPPTDESPEVNATHLGTFESAIENMLRRMCDEDDAEAQFFFHRVFVTCNDSEVSPLDVEPTDFLGNVRLRLLTERGYRILRYINVHERPGSISLAVFPSVITHIQTISVPAGPHVKESKASSDAFAMYTAECDAVNARRPSTEGISRLEYLFPRNPDTAPTVRAARACDKELESARERYLEAMVAEHLPTVGRRTRSKLLDALGHACGDSRRFHNKFRLLAELVQNPARTLCAIDAAPIRKVQT